MVKFTDEELAFVQVICLKVDPTNTFPVSVSILKKIQTYAETMTKAEKPTKKVVKPTKKVSKSGKA